MSLMIWTTTRSSRYLVGYIRHISWRKTRLLSLALARSIVPHLPNRLDYTPHLDALDRCIDPDELPDENVLQTFRQVVDRDLSVFHTRYDLEALFCHFAFASAIQGALPIAWQAVQQAELDTFRTKADLDVISYYSEMRCNVIRDQIRNPFQPSRFDPDWRTTTVTQLAKQIYETGDFSITPILADALEEANCNWERLLTHLRTPMYQAKPSHYCRVVSWPFHYRGNWAIDLILDLN
jgi:hypothetical protein